MKKSKQKLDDCKRENMEIIFVNVNTRPTNNSFCFCMSSSVEIEKKNQIVTGDLMSPKLKQSYRHNKIFETAIFRCFEIMFTWNVA